MIKSNIYIEMVAALGKKRILRYILPSHKLVDKRHDPESTKASSNIRNFVNLLPFDIFASWSDKHVA